MRLSKKSAIVTGADRGIGRAIALRFAAEGAAVVVDDGKDFGSQATVDAIVRPDAQASFVGASVLVVDGGIRAGNLAFFM